jgi:protein-S-isoprenylcysteine O-methyltransferase Ste14
MTASRSTPRLRLTALLLLGLLALVAVSERTAATGVAGQALQLAGLLCVACAALGRIWSSIFIAGYKDARLVRRGPYAMLRHPLYALSSLAMLGAGLTTRSVTITATLVVLFAVIHAAAARAEDRFLHGVHGEAFTRYAGEVRGFLPRWSAYEVPETLDIRPRVLWKAFLDAGTAIGFWGLLVLVDALHGAGITPTWITLP